MRRSCHRFVIAAVLCALSLVPRLGLAQAPRGGRLVITVTDPMGGVLPAANVTVTGLEDATKRVAVAPATTTDKGVATFENLALGRYSVRAEFSGFDPGILRDVRVRAGENKQTVSLPLRRITDEITVGQDKQDAATDRSVTFGTALTREQIEALSDDPVQMRQQLMDMAGGDAVFKVDSFEGQQLPSKAQIKSVRISRDQFAAEMHYAGGLSIDIVTQPGNGPFRGNVGGNFYSSSLDGSNPLVAKKGPSQNSNLNMNVSGTLIQNRLGFNAYLFGGNNTNTPIQCSATAAGRSCTNASVRSTGMNMRPSVSVEYALTKDHVLRGSFSVFRQESQNLGLGEYNLADRAYSTESNGYSFYLQQFGPVGRRFVLRTYASLNANDSSSDSFVESRTIVILDARTAGGAQRAGGTSTKSGTLGADLDYVRGRHSVRTGAILESSWYRSDSRSNYLGTYTFESLEAFEAGRPRSFTRQIGDPLVRYSFHQVGVYVQDDIRLRKSLSITPGLRYEVQSHLGDRLNFAPRFGVTWSPFAAGQTTLRGSVGTFYDWLSSNTYQQTLQINGLRQKEINIINPAFPDPGEDVGAAPPTNKYLLSDDLLMPRTFRVSAGLNQRLGRRVNASVLYTHTRGDSMLIGNNLNAPIDGARPDPSFANVIEAVSGGRSRANSINANFTLNLAGIGNAPPVPGSGKRIDWRRGLSMSAGYTFGRNLNNSEGAFSPPSTTLENEWGPAAFDVRSRGNMSIGTGFLRNFNARFAWNASSAPPLNIRTGLDDNRDSIFNDRPIGVARNSERTSGQWNTSAFFSYGFTLGSKTVNTGNGVSITGGPGNFSANITGGQSVPRYRLNVSVNIANLTNHANYTGYSGVITSPFFKQPTNASGVRRVTFNTSVSF